eukprot:10297499-Ditylum_brightwellii.AAC.1
MAIEQEIQQAFTSIEFRTYLEDKFQWKPNIADLFDWELHGSNLTSLSFYQHWFVAKLIHECLPCLGEEFTASAVKTCPCCKMHTETFGLFLYCTHNTKTWHNLQELLTDIYIKKSRSNHLPPHQCFFINDPSTSISNIYAKYPTVDFRPYTAAIKAQAAIR